MRTNALIAIWCILACTGCGGELEDKPAWADLQSVEYDDRASIAGGTEVRRLRDGFEVVAIQGEGNPTDGRVAGPHQPRRSWILLNEHASDEHIKQIVKFPAYKLSCREVDDLKGKVADIDGYVMRFLRSVCSS